jgi:mannose-6-phosphate isomerase-like protein (cupin superfamily)
MKGFVADIEEITEENTDFRRVLYTGNHLQLVLMSLLPGEEIGDEVHATHDQFFRVEEGTGEAVLDEQRTAVRPGFAILVPAGARHNIVNTGTEPLRIYTVYTPPNHLDGRLHPAKVDAERDNADEAFGAAVR